MDGPHDQPEKNAERHDTRARRIAGASFPTGRDFINVILKAQASCAKETLLQSGKFGKKAPKCFLQVGTVLSTLEQLATCHWGCAGGDHIVERLAGVVVGNADSALVLLLGGFYDQSLVQSRSIGEAANLFMLFALDPTLFYEWKSLPQRKRKEVFKPVEVRKSLERHKFSSPIEQHRYGSLSELVHLQPDVSPQDYSGIGQPIIGFHFLQRGFIAALNELALPLSIASVGLAKMSGLEKERLPKERRQEIKDAALKLLRSVGGVDFGFIREERSKKIISPAPQTNSAVSSSKPPKPDAPE